MYIPLGSWILHGWPQRLTIDVARHNSTFLSEPLMRFETDQQGAGATHTEERPTQHTGPYMLNMRSEE